RSRTCSRPHSTDAGAAGAGPPRSSSTVRPRAAPRRSWARWLCEHEARLKLPAELHAPPATEKLELALADEHERVLVDMTGRADAVHAGTGAAGGDRARVLDRAADAACNLSHPRPQLLRHGRIQ